LSADRSSASRLEAAIKRLSRSEKLRLIAGEHPELTELFPCQRIALPKTE